jgi:hypothetical protein
MALPMPVTKQVAGCEATSIPFPAFPTGSALFARVLRAAKPAIAAGSPLLSKAAASLTPAQLAAVTAGRLSPLAALSPALLADAAPFLDALPDVVSAIAGDAQLVADLLAGTTVIVDGKNHKLNTQAAVGAAVGYDYALLVGLVYFAVEVNFAGPLADAFAGLLRGRPAAHAEGETPSS